MLLRVGALPLWLLPAPVSRSRVGLSAISPHGALLCRRHPVCSLSAANVMSLLAVDTPAPPAPTALLPSARRSAVWAHGCRRFYASPLPRPAERWAPRSARPLPFAPTAVRLAVRQCSVPLSSASIPAVFLRAQARSVTALSLGRSLRSCRASGALPRSRRRGDGARRGKPLWVPSVFGLRLLGSVKLSMISLWRRGLTPVPPHDTLAR